MDDCRKAFSLSEGNTCGSTRSTMIETLFFVGRAGSRSTARRRHRGMPCGRSERTLPELGHGRCMWTRGRGNAGPREWRTRWLARLFEKEAGAGCRAESVCGRSRRPDSVFATSSSGHPRTRQSSPADNPQRNDDIETHSRIIPRVYRIARPCQDPLFVVSPFRRSCGQALLRNPAFRCPQPQLPLPPISTRSHKKPRGPAACRRPSWDYPNCCERSLYQVSSTPPKGP